MKQQSSLKYMKQQSSLKFILHFRLALFGRKVLLIVFRKEIMTIESGGF